MFGRPMLRLSLASFAFLCAATVASAQTKVGVMNLQRAVLESAEIKKANGQMEAKYKPRQAKIEDLQKEIQGLAQQIQTNQGKLTPQAEADLTAQGQRRQRELQRMTDDLQADVDAERNQILQGSTRRMQEVVRKIAEEKGLDVVVDVTNTIYFKPVLEITNDVIAAYDKAYPPK